MDAAAELKKRAQRLCPQKPWAQPAIAALTVQPDRLVNAPGEGHTVGTSANVVSWRQVSTVQKSKVMALAKAAHKAANDPLPPPPPLPTAPTNTTQPLTVPQESPSTAVASLIQADGASFLTLSGAAKCSPVQLAVLRAMTGASPDMPHTKSLQVTSKRGTKASPEHGFALKVSGVGAKHDKSLNEGNAVQVGQVKCQAKELATAQQVAEARLAETDELRKQLAALAVTVGELAKALKAQQRVVALQKRMHAAELAKVYTAYASAGEEPTEDSE